MEPLTVSLSAVQAFRRCQTQYHYRYVERLKRKDKAPAPELGIILHDYLACYYKWLQADVPAIEAHQTGLLKISADYMPEIKRFARVAERVGQHDLAAELLEIPGKASRIAERYYLARGQFDAERYEIIYVEQELRWQIRKSLRSDGRLDLVTQDRETGRVHLWDHKSTANVPDEGYRMRDLQTLLYAEKLARESPADIEIDCVLWNYIRTKEPTVPEQLKAGGLTRRADLDSTLEVYSAEVTRLGLNPMDYDEQWQRLAGRELSVFFPRIEQVIVAQADVLLRDYINTAREIRRYRKAWADGIVEPVRNLSMDCTWCEFATLCNAVILGGDESDIREMRFTVNAHA